MKEKNDWRPSHERWKWCLLSFGVRLKFKIQNLLEHLSGSVFIRLGLQSRAKKFARQELMRGQVSVLLWRAKAESKIEIWNIKKCLDPTSHIPNRLAPFINPKAEIRNLKSSSTA